MHITLSTTAAAAVAAGVILAGAIPASADTAASCHYSGAPTTARLSVTRYAKGSGVEYHMDVNTGGSFLKNAIYFDGKVIASNGRTDDIYKDVSGGTHTIKGQWFANVGDGFYVTCQVSL